MINTLQALRVFTKSAGFLSALVLTLTALVGSVSAQSTDRDHPTRLSSDVIKGRGVGEPNTEYYYTFVAGPGEVTVTFDLKAQEQAVIAAGGVTLFDGNAKQLANDSTTTHFGKSERKVASVKLGRRQPVVALQTVGDLQHAGS